MLAAMLLPAPGLDPLSKPQRLPKIGIHPPYVKVSTCPINTKTLPSQIKSLSFLPVLHRNFGTPPLQSPFAISHDCDTMGQRDPIQLSSSVLQWLKMPAVQPNTIFSKVCHSLQQRQTTCTTLPSHVGRGKH